MRLVDGTDEREGRVEICQRQIWAGLVESEDDWDHEEAAVVCSQLGYNPLGELVTATHTNRSRLSSLSDMVLLG